MDSQREKESRIVGSGIISASNRFQSPRIKNKDEIVYPTLEGRAPSVCGTQKHGRKAFPLFNPNRYIRLQLRQLERKTRGSEARNTAPPTRSYYSTEETCQSKKLRKNGMKTSFPAILSRGTFYIFEEKSFPIS